MRWIKYEAGRIQKHTAYDKALIRAVKRVRSQQDTMSHSLYQRACESLCDALREAGFGAPRWLVDGADSHRRSRP